ncbi:polysaccharide deacetylase family protein [Rhodopirellula sp. JC740]|uniref:Polysaccharide deacetylase family protein n=1 Tax=Rhodopirellula halodulae TaxID=2894198 RepID=A0ABS8NP50_9BACT|nr:polysaccharide deacetylase family protein [Rhodopirellula sp. JC740]MCC9645276.1 polysaccharide deacetylase family protein [Rhodopirellula sp. JC740]
MSDRSRRPALFSIHDVMPETIDAVGELISLFHRYDVRKIMLLVVPGRNWRMADLSQLREWQSQGCELAGHGWTHRCQFIRGWKHRLHSTLLSRNVAEHLSLNEDGVVQLMSKCADWFLENSFPRPSLYVPPAWAMGRVRSSRLQAIPFNMVETLSEVVRIDQSRRVRLPLIGFEADTAFREWSLRCLNRGNELLARLAMKPLRVAIHPFDLRFRLGGQLEDSIVSGWQPIGYQSIFKSMTPKE